MSEYELSSSSSSVSKDYSNNDSNSLVTTV